MEDQEGYERARRRVRELKGFYRHLLTYAVVNVGLILIDLVSSPGHLWFYWPLIGWGCAIVAHGLSVFGLAGMFGPDWEEKKIKEILEREGRK
jgi:hypothetical protein